MSTYDEVKLEKIRWHDRYKAERRRSAALRSWVRYALRYPDNSVALKAALAADDRRLKRAKAGR